MAKRGRPTKEVETYDQIKDRLIEEFIIGQHVGYRRPWSLEEIAVAISEDESKMMTKTGINKLIERSLKHAKERFAAKLNIKSYDDVADCHGRQFAAVKEFGM